LKAIQNCIELGLSGLSRWDVPATDAVGVQGIKELWAGYFSAFVSCLKKQYIGNTKEVGSHFHLGDNRRILELNPV